MKIELLRATLHDAQLIHRMKYKAFMPLYNRYRDDETSPAKEPLDKVIKQLQEDITDYYIIRFENQDVGAVRVAEKQQSIFYIAPIFILPEFQDKGIGYYVIMRLFEMYQHKANAWSLGTILQEKRDCHFYEKCGFQKTGRETIVNERMTIIDYEKKMEHPTTH